MHTEQAKASQASNGGIARNNSAHEEACASGKYFVECFDADGKLKWRDSIENLITTVGKNDALDKYLAGSAYTAAFYLGLVDGASTPTYAAGDTMASHSGWTESVAYSNSTRPAPSFGAASSGSKASTATAFTINATATIAGCFLVTNSTKSGTTGILYSCGSFTGGNKSVANGDTLNVTYTASL